MDKVLTAQAMRSCGNQEVLCAFLLDNGYMVPSQWWFRFVAWLMRKRHGSTRIMFFRLGIRAPYVLDELIHQASEHALADGFNKAELAGINAFLKFIS